MNGLVERVHRMGSDAVRSMLLDSGLTRKYWGEAYNYWAYCRNRTAVSFLPNHLRPFEKLHGYKPDVSHLRIFGSPAYARVPPPQRKKLDNKALKGVFVGVFDDAAYRIFFPESNELIKSCDVIIDESNIFRTRKSKSTGPDYPDTPITTSKVPN